MLTVKSGRAPSWNVERTAINLLVVFEETADTVGEMPFTASPDDTADHGRAIYADALEGWYGDIAEPDAWEVSVAVTARREASAREATDRITALDTRLATLADAIELDMATAEELAAKPAIEAEQKAWRIYRVKLSQLEAQEGYPAAVTWPEAPATPFVIA